MCRKITSHSQPLFSKKMAAVPQRPHFPTKLAAVASFSFPTKLAAAASFSNKIGGGGKDLATILVAVLTWSGYWKIRLCRLSEKNAGSVIS